MSRVEDIDTGIWSDPDFTALSPIARAVYVWSWTNSHCGMAGLYKIDRRMIEFETGWTGDQLAAALVELEAARMVFYDGRVMYVKARTKRLRSKSPNIAKRCARDLENVGLDHPFAEAYLERYRSVSWLQQALDEVCSDLHKTLAKGSDPSEGSQGKGKGKGNGKDGGPGEGKPGSEERTAEFVEWLAFHNETTEQSSPKPGTKVREEAFEMFGARRSEGYSLEDLRLAVLGAQADDYRREHGYVDVISVLRPTKIHALIERGRGAGPKLRAINGAVDPFNVDAFL